MTAVAQVKMWCDEWEGRREASDLVYMGPLFDLCITSFKDPNAPRNTIEKMIARRVYNYLLCGHCAGASTVATWWVQSEWDKPKRVKRVTARAKR